MTAGKEIQKSRLFIYGLIIFFVLLVGVYWILDKAPIAQQFFSKDQMIAEKPAEVNDTNFQRGNGLSKIIVGLVISPERPTALDSLKVNVRAVTPKEGSISYVYQWQINGKTVGGVKGDVLPAGLARKNDRVTVTVIPIVDSIERKEFGYVMHAIIQSAAPTLALKEEIRKEGDVMEFQLVGTDPDGGKIVYALEQPVLEGMVINKETGQITWKPAKKEKGVYRFVASATDTDGSKTTKTFEFNLDVR